MTEITSDVAIIVLFSCIPLSLFLFFLCNHVKNKVLENILQFMFSFVMLSAICCCAYLFVNTMYLFVFSLIS